MGRGSAARVPRAVVVGGSVAGLFAARLLERIGWDVAVFERSTDELASRGAGIATHRELHDALERVSSGASEALGVRLTGRVVFDRDGGIVGRHDLPQVTTSWDLLYSRLREGLREGAYRVGARLVDVETGEAEVCAVFADGRRERADLLIGADGVRSTVRSILQPTAQPGYAGYVAWRGMTPEWLLSDAAGAALADRIAFALPPGEQFITYAVAGEGSALDPGRRRQNWVWYRQAGSEEAFERLFTDAEGRLRDISMPPNHIDPTVVAAMRDAAARRLPPCFRELVAATDSPFLQAIYDLASPRLVFGRVALIGDAAFVARPHTGYGVTKAAEDAVALADALTSAAEDGIDAALARWGAARAARGRSLVERGRALGRLLHADRTGPAVAPFERWGTVPAAVLAETAVSPESVSAP